MSSTENITIKQRFRSNEGAVFVAKNKIIATTPHGHEKAAPPENVSFLF